jgi:hypothetical protein
VDNIATELRADASNRDLAFQHVTQLLTEISDQTEALSQFSSDYAIKLQQSLDGVRDQSEQDMSAIKESMKLIEDSQARLAESLLLLSKQIEEHRQQADSQAEADEWTQLLGQTETQTTSLSRSDMQATTSQSLNGAAQTLQGLAALDSGNGRLSATSTKVTGLSNTFDGFGKLGGLFGSFGAKKPTSSNQSSSPQKHAPRSPARRLTATSPTPVYTKKSPACQERIPMRNLAPPPQRISSVPENHTGASRSNQESPTAKPIVPQVKVLPPPPPPPPPLPPRSIVSAPSAPAEEGVANKPKLPPRSPRRPTVPRKSQTLSSLGSPKLLASDTTIQSPGGLLPPHPQGRSASSASPVGVIVSTTGMLSSSALGLGRAAGSDRDYSSGPASASSISSSPGCGNSSPSLIRFAGSSSSSSSSSSSASDSSDSSLPRPPTSFGIVEEEEEALSNGIEEEHVEILSFAQKRERIQGSLFSNRVKV